MTRLPGLAASVIPDWAYALHRVFSGDAALDWLGEAGRLSWAPCPCGAPPFPYIGTCFAHACADTRSVLEAIARSS
jgi:hypothetical protein